MIVDKRSQLTGDLWGGFAAMLVALPAAIAFGVTIFAPLGAEYAGKGALSYAISGSERILEGRGSDHDFWSTD